MPRKTNMLIGPSGSSASGRRLVLVTARSSVLPAPAGGSVRELRLPHRIGAPGYPGLPWLARIRPSDSAFRRHAYRVAKRVIDVGMVVVFAPVLLPLLTLCYLAIKLTSPRAPAFFTQLRTGLGGARFRMFKFRTMVPNAEELKHQLTALNKLHWPDFKIDNDPRITRIGHILRKTSLDELPQVFNVLKGEMSLVGPRPTSFSADTYEEWQKARLEAVPGITGLWQINGRGEMEFDERVRLDLLYIDRQCLALDFQILLRTVGVVLTKRGAH